MQPAAGNSSQCGFLLMISASSTSDWLMGPCQEKTNPGAFLCTLRNKTTLKQEPSSGNFIRSANTIEYKYLCPAGWTFIKSLCFSVHFETILCLDRHISTWNETIGLDIVEWISYFYMHDAFPCTEISYTLSSGEIRIVHKDISSGRRIQQCVMCITEAQVVSGCPRRLYQCDDGSCIIPAAVCNGKWNCVHGEDEHK